MKPRIRWLGNGDVHASCFSVYRKCYPNNIATFRTDPQHLPHKYRFNLLAPPVLCGITNPKLISTTEAAK